MTIRDSLFDHNCNLHSTDTVDGEIHNNNKKYWLKKFFLKAYTVNSNLPISQTYLQSKVYFKTIFIL